MVLIMLLFLKDGETIKDLINYAGGLKIESNQQSLKVVRFDKNSFDSFDINDYDYVSFKD